MICITNEEFELVLFESMHLLRDYLFYFYMDIDNGEKGKEFKVFEENIAAMKED